MVDSAAENQEKSVESGMKSGSGDLDPPDEKTLDKKKLLKALERSRNFLLSTQSTEGWWPYKEENACSLEATAWSGLALQDEKETAKKTAEFLLSCQNKDGGWSTAPGAGFSDWVTGPVMLTLRVYAERDDLFDEEPGSKKRLEEGLRRVLESRVSFYNPTARLLIFMLKGQEGLKYSRGWPWDPDTYHWIEPTSYHLLSLKVPGLPEPGLYEEITKLAEKFIIEHPCKGGGWNHGNDISLGAYLPAYQVTTAEALLGLQGRGSLKSVQDGLKYLKSLSSENPSCMALAWTILALDAYDLPVDIQTDFLIDRQTENGAFSENIMVNALSLMALKAANGQNFLKIKSTRKT